MLDALLFVGDADSSTSSSCTVVLSLRRRVEGSCAAYTTDHV
jgi:hypothetical protein